ncbi:aldehyde dehydrogenase [Candidatus Uhrbacteria bacterium]|nr:aldehyde dehydrogenase [Candidatus Uhrbacteria bacterium]
MGNENTANEAVHSARQALPGWAAKTPMDRGRIIASFLELMRGDGGKSLAAMMRLEAGKPIHEALGEVMKTIQILEWALGIGQRLGGITRSGEGGAVELSTRARPLGVVALTTPWNFPVAVPVWKLAPALIAGNTVVFKGSEHTPAVNTMIGEMLMQAGMPAGVVNVVQGGREVVEPLVLHQQVRGVSFTGSTQVGHAIHRLLAQRDVPIPYQAELGGNNGVYIGQSADLDLAVEGVIAGKYGSAGQRCTATQRVIVHASVMDAFLSRLTARVGQIQLGLSDDPNIKTMGPLATQTALDRVLAMCKQASDAGQSCLIGGIRADLGDLQYGFYVEPTVIRVTDPSVRIWREEVFGPVLAVLAVDSFEKGVNAVNDSDYGFVASIYSEDRRELQAFRDAVEAGMIHFNEATAGGEPQVGFGGWKLTGIGPREMNEGVDFFVRRQTIFDSCATSGGKLATR